LGNENFLGQAYISFETNEQAATFLNTYKNSDFFGSNQRIEFKMNLKTPSFLINPHLRNTIYSLKVNNAPNPNDIIFINLGYSKVKIFFRKLFSFFVLLVFIYLTTWLFVSLKI
jgi:hypothetical protein